MKKKNALLGDRFDALLLLSSWGQCHEYAQYAHYRLLDQPPSVPAPGRVRKWQTRPMNRADFARELRVSPTAIGDLVRRRLKEGLMVQHPKSSRLLVPATLIEKAAGA